MNIYHHDPATGVYLGIGQADVGEAGAIAALDDLYANNDEGMKRLADAS